MAAKRVVELALEAASNAAMVLEGTLCLPAVANCLESEDRVAISGLLVRLRTALDLAQHEICVLREKLQDDVDSL